QIVEDAEASAQHTLPALTFGQLISHAEARREIIVSRPVVRRARRREPERLWIVQALHRVEGLAVSSLGRRVELPARPVGERQTAREFPGVLRVGGKVCED